MVKTDSPKGSKEPNNYGSSKPSIVSKKDIQVIDLTNGEVPVPATLKQRRLMKDGNLVNKHVVDILSSDEETMIPLFGKRRVFDDIEKNELMKKPKPSSSKSQKYIDEDIDDDKIDVKCSQNTNKGVLHSNKLIDDESFVDLDDSENNSVDLINDVDECDVSFEEDDATDENHIDDEDEDEFADFIDDGPINDVATSDEDTDDDF
ncbi:hypothetical protein Tco_0232526 [Tanacetum coccineum]